MAAKLIVTKHKQDITEIVLDKTLLTIGRKHINDLHLDDPGVSGSHAKLLTVGSESFIEDLNSTNGTFLNNERVTKSALKNQDCILIGEFKLLYQNDDISSDDDMEKTIIMKAGSVLMSDPETVPTKDPAPKIAAPANDSTPAQSHASSGPVQATLTVIDGASIGKSLVLSGIITRVKGPNGQSSVISKKDDGYYMLNTLLKDVAPAINGIAVQVGSTKLNNGDIISMGNSQLRFKS